MISIHARLWTVPHPTFLLCLTQRLLASKRWWLAYVCSVMVLPLACRHGHLEHMRAQWVGALAASNLISGTRVYRRLGQVLKEDLALLVLRRRLVAAPLPGTCDDLCALLRASLARQPEATGCILRELAPRIVDPQLVGRLVWLLIERDAADVLVLLPLPLLPLPLERCRELLEHCAHVSAWNSLEVLFARLGHRHPSLAHAVLRILTIRNHDALIAPWLVRVQIRLNDWELKELQQLARVHGSWETAIVLETLAPC